MALVLIIDDSPTELHVLARILRQGGHEAVTATDGEAGIAADRLHSGRSRDEAAAAAQGLRIGDTLVLPVGGSVTYTVPCDIDAAATDTLVNTASVSSAVSDPAPGNENATDSNELIASADLRIDKTDGQASVTPGESRRSTCRVSN